MGGTRGVCVVRGDGGVGGDIGGGGGGRARPPPPPPPPGMYSLLCVCGGVACVYIWVRMGWLVAVGVRVCVRRDGRGGGGGAAIATGLMFPFG